MTADPAPETPAATPETPAPYGRGRRYTIRALMFVATLLLLVSIIALWANRQVFDANNWADTSGAMLENDAIKSQLGGYLVDQVYANVDVTGEVAAALPPRLKPLAGPAANGLRGLAESRMNTLLARPRIEEAWRAANKATAQQFINIAEGNSGAVTTQGNAVVLDLRVMLTNITARLGAAQSLVAKIPPGAGTIKIMSADQISAVQNLTSAIKGLAFVLPLLAVALFALAVYLATGHRRRVLMWVGIDFVIAGAIALVARRLGGNAVVDSLATTDSVRPAVEAAYTIGTGILKDVAQATIIIGIPVIVAAWLAGPMRPAVALRRAAAPWLRDEPLVAYGVAGLLVLIVIAWGPIPATQMLIPIILMFVLVALGVYVLRVQTAEEFPDATRGGTRASLQASAGRARDAMRGARNSRRQLTDGAPAEAARLDELERLASLHERGVLTDDEFSAQKATILAGGGDT
jgi:putative oligomerization/nucleic acid binding protein